MVGELTATEKEMFGLSEVVRCRGTCGRYWHYMNAHMIVDGKWVCAECFRELYPVWFEEIGLKGLKGRGRVLGWTDSTKLNFD